MHCAAKLQFNKEVPLQKQCENYRLIKCLNLYWGVCFIFMGEGVGGKAVTVASLQW